MAAVCTGAGVLAAAGFLDGRRASTHWEHAAFLASRFPAVEFDSGPVFVSDGHVCTSASVTAALDLTSSFIESDVSPDLARDVSRQWVTYLQRPGNQAQMSMFTAPSPTNSVIQDAVAHIARNPAADLSTPALARSGVSGRHLARLFLAETGMTLAHFVRRARSEEALRQAFRNLYGVSPSHYRATQATSEYMEGAQSPYS